MNTPISPVPDAPTLSRSHDPTSGDFELILQHNRPVAAVIPHRVLTAQLVLIYKLLPDYSINQRELCDRWNKAFVLSSDDWAREQLRRMPMLPPHGVKLSFVQ